MSNTGHKMKKLALNFLKTADEKLRNIGKSNSSTVVQTQNFTFYKSQPNLENDQDEGPRVQVEERSAENTQFKPRPDDGGSPVQQQDLVVTSDMEERVALRQLRRDKNGHRALGEEQRSDLKRRSKSEGPNRRVRQSMDERQSGKKQTFDGGGRRRELQESSDSDESVRGSLQTSPFVAAESESDSDHQKWTKNPLVVRRVKKSEKTRQVEKRFSGIENGVKNTESWGHYKNEDGGSRTGSLGGGNSSSRDSGSSSKGSNKYQKLEEMRKKRINLAVTSDEENTPAVRISRLRQRALQGVLGDQMKSANANQSSSTNYSNSNYDYERQDKMQRSQLQQLQNSVSSDPGIKNFTDNGSEFRFQNSSGSGKVQGMTPTSQPSIYTNQIHNQTTENLKPVYTSNSLTQKQNVLPLVAKQNSSLSSLNGSLNQPFPRVNEKTAITQLQKQPPARPPPPNIPASRQSFYTIPEPNSTQTTRGSNDSPEVVVRRLTTQVRIHSTDSIVNSSPKTAINTGISNHPVTFSNNLRQIHARGSPTPNQELFHAINNTRSTPQFNDAVEMRLKSNRDSRIDPQPKLPKKPTLNSNSFACSDDTLDELIESNIQYLDSELDTSKPKKNSSTVVSRSSSLPDPRRISTHATSTQSLTDQSPIQVQANNNIEIHVSLPTDHRHSGGSFKAPLIQIAPSNVIAYKSDYGLDSHLLSQPDVVPRKYSYDSHARLSRPNSEYYDRDDMSKSDSQLNAQVVLIPSYLGNNLHPNQAYVRGCVSDMNLRSDVGIGLQAQNIDMGMFSDVEYDIQVSERVKKWETFMKVSDLQPSGEQKSMNLTTIQENNEIDSLMLPSEVRKSVLLSKNGGFGTEYPNDHTPPSSRPRPFSSDTALNKSLETNALKMLSGVNANRFFEILPNPLLGPRFAEIQTQSVSSLYHMPVSSKPENNFLSASELRQQMLANRHPVLPITNSSVKSVFPSSPLLTSDYQPRSQKETSVMSRSSNYTDLRDLAKRGSKYHEEIHEINSVKADSVLNLRRRFGADSTAGTSEDDQWSVSTASAKLSRPSKTSPSQSEADSMDLSCVLPGFESIIKDGEVWSPNLETTQGVPVSIERVTARTLQTIPFSEDPFWKEIEEMTSFDPNSMAGHLSVSKTSEPTTTAEQIKSEHQSELTTPHSSTLPTQPRSNSMTLRDRMQRSKSLYTPNITPLSINVSEKSSSSAVSALDDVLEDINRSSIERKQLSPKKKAHETTSSTGTSSSSGYLKMKQDQPQHGFKFEGGQFTFIKPGFEPQPKSSNVNDSSNPQQESSEKVTFQSKQPVQFYQLQRKDSQQQNLNRQSQVINTGVNNYHLDANLLKQKLLNTGLVVDTDTEEPIPFKQTRSSSLGNTAPIFIPQNTSQSFTSLASKAVKPDEKLQRPFSGFAVQPDVQSTTEPTSAAPWAVKQPGPNALHDIQKALAPFESSSYQPDAETLYGTTRLQSFNNTNFSTSRGPHVTTTSWTYQPKAKQDPDAKMLPSDSSLSRLQEVNASMDDLKDLAQNVERKINEIKGKLQTADEKSLDSILTSLKKLTPDVKSQVSDTTDLDDYYSSKKSKLTDALNELNRIYDELQISNDGVTRLPERVKQRPYRGARSDDFVIAPAQRSENLRPTQTRISSVFIPGLQRSFKNLDLDKDTESEFDVISKSFQAIVDEVNQTTDMFSRAAGNNGLENLAPETHNQASKIVLRPENSATYKAHPVSSSESVSSSAKFSSSNAQAQPEIKSKGGRFRAKLQGNNEESQFLGRNRSQSIPGLESNSKHVLVGAVTSNSVSQSTIINTAKVAENTTPNAAAVTSPAARQRMRIRPVKDNKIIQNDMVSKKQVTEKGTIIYQSPQPSPVVTRKIIYNNGLGSEPKSPTLGTAKEEVASQPLYQTQATVKQSVNAAEEKMTSKSGAKETKQPLGLSPGIQKKVPPPTAAKPHARSEVAMSTSSTPVTSSIMLASKVQQNKAPTIVQLTSGKANQGDRIATDNQQKQASTSVSINLAPVVSHVSQSSHSLVDSKQEDADPSSGGGQRSRRRLGTGVAMMMDKFTPTEDSVNRINKNLGTRSAPDLIESLDEGENYVTHSKKVTTEIKLQPKLCTDNKQHAQKINVTQTPRSNEARTPFPALDGSKFSFAKSFVFSSSERKVVDSEGVLSNSGSTTPQPSSPNNKPPQHPWKRQTSDPDKQLISDALSESNVSSPKFVSKIPRLIATSKVVVVPGNNTIDNNFVQKTDSHRMQKAESPKVMKRSRPPDRKIQTEVLRERPHSFHELLSCFEKEPNRLQGLHRFRKYASADEVNTETLLRKVFMSEPASPVRKTGFSLENAGDKGGVVFKLEMKLKS